MRSRPPGPPAGEGSTSTPKEGATAPPAIARRPSACVSARVCSPRAERSIVIAPPTNRMVRPPSRIAGSRCCASPAPTTAPTAPSASKVSPTRHSARRARWCVTSAAAAPAPTMTSDWDDATRNDWSAAMSSGTVRMPPPPPSRPMTKPSAAPIATRARESVTCPPKWRVRGGVSATEGRRPTAAPRLRLSSASRRHGAPRPNRRRRGCGRADLAPSRPSRPVRCGQQQVQRPSGATVRRTWSTCLPHPVEVTLPQERHTAGLHMGDRPRLGM